MASRPGLIRRLFGALWWLLDASRRLVLNLVFLGLLAAVAWWWFADHGPELKKDTVLILDLNGRIVEQYTAGAREAAIAQALGRKEPESQLRDVLDVLAAAAEDPDIKSVLLMLDDLDGAGLASLREVGAAIDRFKQSGKPVVAWGSSFDQKQYALAAHADEIYMHPFGNVLLKGLGGYRFYYGDAIEKLGVKVHVFKVGAFKSFPEPFIRNAPSADALADEAFWLDNAWSQLAGGIESSRQLPAGSVMAYINALPGSLEAVGGDAAKLALQSKLVDGLKTRDELRALMIERGARDDKTKSFRQIDHMAYLDTLEADTGKGGAVGVIVAEGEIIDGKAEPGTVGDLSTIALIRRARDDDRIQALVVRIDSPGGSAVASEVIRRELEITRAAGKPVIVSMGDVAASGGYWISMAADEVIADPATITGSIGVFGILPTFETTLSKVGVATGGVTTAWLAGAMDPRRPLDPRTGELIQAGVGRIYRDFITLAAAARKTTPEKINEVAQGRVWTGVQAQERNLVDRLGGFDDALAAARTRAQLPDDAAVVFVEQDVRVFSSWFELFFMRARAELARASGAALVPAELRRPIEQEAAWLRAAAAKPLAPITHCLCEPK
ncbi:MAG: signal peptide peptidase SppA [Burkholderiaceae bacterium]